MKRSLVGALAAAALGLTMLAPPAQAEYYGIDDPADASASLSDVYAMHVRHGERTAAVHLNFDDLRRNSQAGVSIFFDTNQSRRGPEFALSSGLGDGTDYVLARARRWRGTGDTIDCDYEAQVKWAKDVFRTKMSRECLGNPARIRVSVKMRDLADGSHPVIDWVPKRQRWSLWLASGSGV